MGTSLENALFVLDEPSVGLHPADIEPLTRILRELALRNNTVLVVEHDPAIIRGADRVVELGPGAGANGGRIVADGPPEILARTGGATARALAGLAAPKRPRRKPRSYLEVRSASANNLEDVNAKLPLGVLCAVTGPSGSGKSTLCVDVVYRALARNLGDFNVELPAPTAVSDGAEIGSAHRPGRPVTPRSHFAGKCCHLHQGLGHDPQALRLRAGGPGTTHRSRALLFQRRWRPMRSV